MGIVHNLKLKLFDPYTHKMFVSRDLVFHEHVHDGNNENNNDEWDIHLLVEEGINEIGEIHENSFVIDEIIEPSPSRDNRNRFYAIPTLKR